MAESGRIFICYRREETAYSAGWLFDRLTDRFGGQIFKDVDSIEPGDDWVEVITRVVGSCDVLLALIGDRWLTITDEDGRRRLDDPDDFVLLEIEAALTRNVRVIPILVEGARMPRAAELPPTLARLARRQALVLPPANFDTSRLVRVLDKTLAEVRIAQEDAAARSAPAGKAPDRGATELSERPEQRKPDESSPVPSVPPAAPATETEVLGDSSPMSAPGPRTGEAGTPPDEDHPKASDREATEPDEISPWQPSGKGPRRTRVLLICGAAAALVVLATIGLVNGLAGGDRDNSREGGDGGSTQPSVTEDAHGLPVSAPLTESQLIVPVLTGDNWDLWLADTHDGKPLLRLTTDPGSDASPAISPDRRTVIYTHDLNTTGKRTLMVKAASAPGNGRPLFSHMPRECQGTVFRPAWNPARPEELAIPCADAEQMNVVAGAAGGLYRITTQGRMLGHVQLPEGIVRLDDPSYSPDGKKLVFWASGLSTYDGATLYTVAVAGGEPQPLLETTREGEDADPVWSPDGRYIVFRRRVPSATTHGNYEIFRVTTDGSARLERLTNDAGDDQDPTYSPSGEEIAYKSAARDPNHPDDLINRIWIMNADGSDKHPLWTEGPDDYQTAAGWGRR